MLKLILIRPGATDYDEQGRIQGVLDVPLNAKGRDEAAVVAEALSGADVEVVYCSACLPAQETAEIVAEKLDVKRKSLDPLRNLDHGLWQGQSIDEIRRKQPTIYRQWQEHPASICPPGGETLEKARARVQPALAKLLKKHKEGVIALVVPEPLASMVRAGVCGGDMGDLWRAAEAHGRWETLEIEPAAVTSGGSSAT